MSKITRRDFLNGVAIGVSSAALLPHASMPAFSQEAGSGAYPPLLTGLRGSHEGSYEVAHKLAWNGEAPDQFDDTGEEYDLVVVGAGLSGLAAGIFFQQARGKNQRILILDNHDDFGGHAKRNEFEVQGQMLLSIGGAVNLDSPNSFDKVTQQLLKDVGIDLKKLDKAMPPGYPLSTMGENVGYFVKTATGESRTIVGRWFAALHGHGDYKSLIEQLPFSQEEKDKIVRLASGDWDYLVGLSLGERADYLSSTSYHQFLSDKVGLASETLALFDSFLRLNVGVGGDGHSVMEAFTAGAPGVGSVGWLWDLGEKFLTKFVIDIDKPYHSLYFPDGNASVARLMVRKLIPSVADGNSMDDITTARFNYDNLDAADAPVRLRLNSTAVRVKQEGEEVTIGYVKDGEPLQVRAKHCILACYNGIIPHLCPELPEEQKEGLKFGSKVPFVWANVALRDGAPFYKAGAQQYECPYSHYCVVTKAPPTKMDDYQAPQNHSDPLVVFMMRSVAPVKQPGQTARDVYREGRTELYTKPFSVYEKEVRDQLTDMFGEHGFDADRDIEAITINRWPHGYAYDYLELDDGPYAKGEYPHEIGRRQFGRISIANSDSQAEALITGAVDAAWRATREQLYIANDR
jgi:spermidine dehydrogenase